MTIVWIQRRMFRISQILAEVEANFKNITVLFYEETNTKTQIWLIAFTVKLFSQVWEFIAIYV